jgi:hypothetical protein
MALTVNSDYYLKQANIKQLIFNGEVVQTEFLNSI